MCFCLYMHVCVFICACKCVYMCLCVLSDWMYLGMAGGVLFLLLQLLLLVDFTHAWNATWLVFACLFFLNGQ